MQLGSVVRFRERDWVVVARENEVLFLRPLTGTSDDIVAVHRGLSNLIAGVCPTERLTNSSFPPPLGLRETGDSPKGCGTLKMSTESG